MCLGLDGEKPMTLREVVAVTGGSYQNASAHYTSGMKRLRIAMRGYELLRNVLKNWPDSQIKKGGT